MRMKKNKMKGFSPFSVLFLVVLFGLVGIYGIQIALGLIDQQSIRQAAKVTLQDAKTDDSSTVGSIKTSFLHRMNSTTVEITDDDVTVSRADNGFEIDVEHTKKIKMTEHIHIVMDLDVSETTAK